MVRLLATAALGLLSIALLAVIANAWTQGKDDRVLVAKVAAEEHSEAGGAMVIKRNSRGQFHLDAAVNGEEANFLVDTGADLVALSPDEAERLGVAFDEADFKPIMQTATGSARGTVGTIDRLEVGEQELRNVPVAVVEGLDGNLLGQSALGRLGRVSLHGDRLTIGG